MPDPNAEFGPGIELRKGRFGRTYFVRLRPNIDLVIGLEQACAEAGIKSAVLRGAIGSVNFACFESASGRTHRVDQPGLEILTLKGSVEQDEAGNPRATITGTVADEAGTLHAGHFTRGENLICITAEICLEEWVEES